MVVPVVVALVLHVQLRVPIVVCFAIFPCCSIEVPTAPLPAPWLGLKPADVLRPAVVTPAFSGGEVFIVVIGVLITTEVPLHSPLLFTARQIAIQFVVVVVIVVIITLGDADVFVIIATAFAVPSLLLHVIGGFIPEIE